MSYLSDEELLNGVEKQLNSYTRAAKMANEHEKRFERLEKKLSLTLKKLDELEALFTELKASKDD